MQDISCVVKTHRIKEKVCSDEMTSILLKNEQQVQILDPVCGKAVGLIQFTARFTQKCTILCALLLQHIKTRPLAGMYQCAAFSQGHKRAAGCSPALSQVCQQFLCMSGSNDWHRWLKGYLCDNGEDSRPVLFADLSSHRENIASGGS